MNKISVNEFWNWFLEKSEFLMDIDNLAKQEQENLLKEFEEILSSYSEGMSFEITDLTQDGRKIIFSAEGDVDYFDDVIELCENTPILDFWDIIAFKQGKGANVKMRFDKYSFNSKEMWFVPLENTEQENPAIGLRIAVKDYEEENEDLLIAAYSLIEAMIGEYDTATLLDYFELCPIPQQNPEEEDFIPLTELPNFIDWHLNKINRD